MSKVPEPLASLRKFVKEARKAEKKQGISAGEILWGSITHNGEKKLLYPAVLTNKFLDMMLWP